MGDTSLHPGTIPTGVLYNLGDGACRTTDELESALGFTRRQISDGAAKLISRGYLERIEKGCFQLTKSGIAAVINGVEIKSGPWKPHSAISRKPRRNTLRQRVWNVMRMCPSFTYADLEIAAARNEQNPINNIQKFMGPLIKAGYVVQMPNRKRGARLTSNGFKQFRLVNNTGPIAPTPRMSKRQVFDNNTQEAVSWIG